MLELVQVTKRYDGREVVRDVDLAFQPGKTNVLIGPSGCGKTTILKMLIGLVSPDSGQVRIDGKPAAEFTEPTCQRFGYVIQTGGLFPHLTAAENIALPARFLSWPSEKIGEATRRLTGLTDFPEDGLARFPVQLSGGQRQRVGLMRALLLEPDLLLLDEPLGALDPMIRDQLQTQLKQIFRQLKKTVVLVTHDLNEAAYLGDRLVLLNDGRIVQQGSAADLRDRPASEFVTEFVNAQKPHFEDAGSQGGAS
ncbi:MAG: ATP-binding cassette domain-containing protein [Pirellulaceae bacterium]